MGFLRKVFGLVLRDEPVPLWILRERDDLDEAYAQIARLEDLMRRVALKKGEAIGQLVALRDLADRRYNEAFHRIVGGEEESEWLIHGATIRALNIAIALVEKIGPNGGES